MEGFRQRGAGSTLNSVKIRSAGEDGPRADGEGQVRCSGPTSSRTELQSAAQWSFLFEREGPWQVIGPCWAQGLLPG